MKDVDKLALTREEILRVHEIAGEGAFYAHGLYSEVKGGLTLEEAHLKAISQPNNSEHIPAWNRARDILRENAEMLGIVINHPDDEL